MKSVRVLSYSGRNAGKSRTRSTQCDPVYYDETACLINNGNTVCRVNISKKMQKNCQLVFYCVQNKKNQIIVKDL